MSTLVPGKTSVSEEPDRAVSDEYVVSVESTVTGNTPVAAMSEAMSAAPLVANTPSSPIASVPPSMRTVPPFAGKIESDFIDAAPDTDSVPAPIGEAAVPRLSASPAVVAETDGVVVPLASVESHASVPSVPLAMPKPAVEPLASQ